MRVEPRRITVLDRPAPVPADGEVLLRPLLAGVCGGDLMYFTDAGHVAGVTEAYVVCHEVLAEVVGTGARVVIDPMVHCGTCGFCTTARPQLCHRRRDRGYGADGVAAELISVPADKVFAVPDGVPDEAAAVAHGLAAVLHALDQADTGRPPDTALVLGPGPAGMMFALVLRARGADVVLAGRPSSRLRHAAALGLRTVELGSALVGALADDSFDLVVETTGAASVQEAALPLARRGGTYLLYAPGRFTLDATMVFRREIRVQGSTGVTGRMDDALRVLRDGAVPVADLVTHTFGLDHVQEAFELASSPPGPRGHLVKALIDVGHG